MKKKDKISQLLFKKADNAITEKELRILNKYLEKNCDLKEECVLIENLRKEFENLKDSPLPENFNIKLREKLVDYNLNNAPYKNKKNLFKINITATAVLAVFLIAFSLGTNHFESFKTSEKEIEPEYNFKTSDSQAERRTRELTTGGLEDANTTTRQRANAEVKSNTVNSSKELNTPSSEITSNEISDENFASQPETVATADHSLEESTEADTLSNGGNSGGGSSGSSSSGGGGGSSAPIETYDFSHSVSNIVITTNCDNALFDNIKKETVYENIFKIDIKEYSNVINVLNNIPYEIKNFSEENLLESYFYIENKQ